MSSQFNTAEPTARELTEKDAKKALKQARANGSRRYLNKPDPQPKPLFGT